MLLISFEPDVLTLVRLLSANQRFAGVPET
jgi:hypothetical protein